MTDKKVVTREKIIIKTSFLGILANFFLAGFKALAGLLSNSIAIVLDAVNNLSDALSSLITIIGTKIAGKKPDKKHPYGHGRVEYLSTMIIAVIILYAGITSLIESVKKIINPVVPDYSVLAIVIVSVAILVKIFLGIYFRKVGKRVNSDSLVGSGSDALMDSIISAATLVSAIIFISFGLSLEAYLGVIIALLIIKTGISMLKAAISQILGERVDKSISVDIKKTISSFDGVYGAYDLVLDNYGPDKYMGSIHIEVSDTTTAAEIDELTREIMKAVYDKHGVILTAVGVYSFNTKDEEAKMVRDEISKIVHSHKTVLQMHGFYLNKKDKSISFDIILDFADEERNKTYAEIYDEVQAKFPDYKLAITMDIDVSD
ncbi:MAG: cation transporter [Clostridia bacterium]|nr:cation transporter [Clostridia bacterium]